MTSRDSTSFQTPKKIYHHDSSEDHAGYIASCRFLLMEMGHFQTDMKYQKYGDFFFLFRVKRGGRLIKIKKSQALRN